MMWFSKQDKVQSPGSSARSLVNQQGVVTQVMPGNQYEITVQQQVYSAVSADELQVGDLVVIINDDLPLMVQLIG